MATNCIRWETFFEMNSVTMLEWIVSYGETSIYDIQANEQKWSFDGVH